uniref:Uncharacterized protein n=1 Tax=Anopheles merus TaxID=30066 RepID=A0A182VLX3_ANOME
MGRKWSNGCTAVPTTMQRDSRQRSDASRIQENPGLEWRIASPDSSYAFLDRVDGDVAAASRSPVPAGWVLDPSFPPRMCSRPSRNSRKLTCVFDPVIKHLTSRWPRSFSSSVWHSLTSASRSSAPLPGLLCAWNM